MEAVSPISSLAPESPHQHDAQQARIDPNYSLHYQAAAISHANGQSLATDEGARRTNSRRRKSSGSGGSGIPAPVPMPAAPDVPRSSRGGGPPISYRDPYGGEAPMPVEPSSKSFSARAAAARSDAFDAAYAAYGAPDPPFPAEARRQERRISTGHEAPVTFPQPVKAPEPSYTRKVEPGPVKKYGEVSRSSPQVQPQQQPSRHGSQEVRRGSSGAPPRRSNTVHSSTGEPSDWAAERSPLQRLEVKLNDISKEEKRQRVMEAEARLRASKTSSRHVSESGDPNVDRSGSRRVSSGETQRRSSQGGPKDRAITNQQYASASAPVRQGSTRDPIASGRRTSSGTGPSGSQKTAYPETADQLEVTSLQKPVDVTRNDSRAVRFSGPSTTNNERQFPIVPGTGKAERVRGEALDSVSRSQSTGHRHGPKYHVPPQTSAGVEARKKIDFGDRADEVADAADRRSHRFSNVFHRRHDSKLTSIDPSAAPRHIDEWRQGGVALLTLKDAIAPAVEPPKQSKDQAWWDYSQSVSQRRRSSAQPGITALDGAQEDSTGKKSPINFPNHSASFAFLNHRARRDQQTQQFRIPGHPYTYKNRVWRGFRGYGQPRSINESIDSGTSRHSSDPSFVSTASVPQEFNPPLYLKCGPLLRYTGLRREKSERSGSGKQSLGKEIWRGSIMIVTEDAKSEYTPVPTLSIFHQPMDLLPPPPQQYDGSKEEQLQSEYVDPIAGLPRMTRTGGTVYVKPVEDLEVGKDVSRVEDDDGLYEQTRTALVPTSYGKADELLGRSSSTANGRGNKKSDMRFGRHAEVEGVRLHTERGMTFWRFNIEIELGEKELRIAYRVNQGTTTGFWVPPRGQVMHIMFHSCNGFSRSVDSNDFSGPDPLWRDVLNAHQLKPFHVMIGGGDQIYNDLVMDECPLFKQWLDHKNPHHKHEAEFTPQLQDELETFFLNRYCMWFSQGLFGMANSQIPMINIWDDHDIIDGFGSYPHHFMSSKVFSGLGNVAFKYYMLFQHQSVVNETQADEPSWLLGSGPGPYINELNRSVLMSLGGGVMFLGIDCRTERTRDEVLSEASYDLIFDRCDKEIIRGETKHLIVLLGVPIAYPRLVWLENILTSRAMDPLKALGRLGLFSGVMNKFDGGVEVVDDLDDHWTARNHKEERNWFIEELQYLAAGKSVRITILSGDVHLAAVGQFYSNKALKIPKDKDHRYMPNIVSSAIVNTPPPDMVADVLNKRNKIHHLNEFTDEDMIPMFTHDVDGKPRNNKHLLPKRNWCSITEYLPGSTPASTPSSLTPTASQESLPEKPPNRIQRTLSLGGGDFTPANLIRRLSTSNREPDPYIEGSSPGGGGFTPANLIRRLSSSNREPDSYIERSPSPPPKTSHFVTSPIPIRPVTQFHRRPTNLSEKAAAKGGFEHGGQISLQHGLDIQINCEIKQGDPAGSTEVYRLLVPILSCAEDDNDNNVTHKPRKMSMIQRWNSRRRGGSAAQQGAGNWGQDGTESDSETEASARDFYGLAAQRPNVIHQQAPAPDEASPSRGPPRAEVPKRSISLLQKRPRPFLPRPKAEPKQDVASRANFPPISAPIPQTQSPDMQQNTGSVRSPQFRLNATKPVMSHDGADEDLSETETETEDDEDLYHTRPKRKVGGKFDKTGGSNYFGAGPAAGRMGPPDAGTWGSGAGADADAGDGGGGIRAKLGLGRSNSLPLPGRRASIGYDGIEAFKEKKGWRKFF